MIEFSTHAINKAIPSGYNFNCIENSMVLQIRAMKLVDWFKIKNPDGSKRRKGKFAESIGKSNSTVTAYLDGRAWPDREAMAKIAAATAGDVTANDFVETAEAAE